MNKRFSIIIFAVILSLACHFSVLKAEAEGENKIKIFPVKVTGDSASSFDGGTCPAPYNSVKNIDLEKAFIGTNREHLFVAIPKGRFITFTFPSNVASLNKGVLAIETTGSDYATGQVTALLRNGTQRVLGSLCETQFTQTTVFTLDSYCISNLQAIKIESTNNAGGFPGLDIVSVYIETEEKPQETSVANATVTLPAAEYTCTGFAIKPAPTVKLNGKILKKGTDYSVSYSGNRLPGNASVMIRGTGSYTGKKTVYFTITLPIPAISVVPVSANSVKLTWAPVKGGEKYKIYRKTGSGKFVFIKEVSQLTYTDASLKYSTTYQYYVKAVSGSGQEGKKSNTVSITTFSNVVSNIRVTKRSEKKIRVSWTKVIGASGYDVSLSNQESGVLKAGTTGSSVLYKDLWTPLKMTYYIKVRPWKKVGTLKIYGKWSSAVLYSNLTWAERMNQFQKDPRWGTNGKAWGAGKKPELSNYGSESCLAYVNDFVAYVYGRRNVKSDKRDKKRPDCTVDDKATDKNIQNIKAGDVVAFYNSKGGKHYFAVISYDKSTGRMYTMEGNASHKIRVGDTHYRIKDGKLQENWPSKGKDNWSDRTFRWTKHFNKWKAE